MKFIVVVGVMILAAWAFMTFSPWGPPPPQKPERGWRE